MKVIETTIGLDIPLVDRATSGAKDFLSFVSTSEFEYFDEAKFSEGEIRKILNDSSTEKKLEGMKRILATHSAGRDVSRLFPDVVKNVGVTDLKLKKLVYMYLILHAEGDRDLALLSINSFQRDLSHRNQLVRGVALRAIASIRLLEIIPLVMSSIKRAVGDSSPYVRKIAAQSIPKVYNVDHDQFVPLRALLLTLLPDIEYCVVGVAIASFQQICVQHTYKYGTVVENPHTVTSNFSFNEQRIIPQSIEPKYLDDNVSSLNVEMVNSEKCTALSLMYESLSLLHPHYRYLCDCLVHLESWAQVSAIDILFRYCRFFFADISSEPLIDNSLAKETVKNKKLSSIFLSPNIDTSKLSADFLLFLNALLFLLHSQSPAVVCTASSALYSLAPESFLDKVADSLLRCYTTCSAAYKEALLSVMLPIIENLPHLFFKYIGLFFVVTTDSTPVKLLKLEILQRLAVQDDLADIVLRELEIYCLLPGNSEFTQKVMRVMTTVALRQDRLVDACFKKLVNFLDYKSTFLLSEVVVAMRTLMQQRITKKLVNVITHLVNNLQYLKVHTARASVVWIIGEYQHEIVYLAPDVLRMLTKGFVDEHDEVKVQILTMALKIWAFHFYNKYAKSEKLINKNDFVEKEIEKNFAEDQKSSTAVDENGKQCAKQNNFDGEINCKINNDKKEEKDNCANGKTEIIDISKIFTRLDFLFVYLCELASKDIKCDVRDIARLYLIMTRTAMNKYKTYGKIEEADKYRSASDEFLEQSSIYEDNVKLSSNECNGNAWNSKNFDSFCLEYLKILSLPQENRAEYLTSIFVLNPLSQQVNNMLAPTLGTSNNQTSIKNHLNKLSGEKRVDLKFPLHSLSFLLGEKFPGFLPIPQFLSNVSSDDSIRNPANREGIGSREIKSIEGGSGFMRSEVIRNMHKDKKNEKIVDDLEEFYSSEFYDQNNYGKINRDIIASAVTKSDDAGIGATDNVDELDMLWKDFDTNLRGVGKGGKGGMFVFGEDEESDEESNEQEVEEKEKVPDSAIITQNNEIEDTDEDDWKYVPKA